MLLRYAHTQAAMANSEDGHLFYGRSLSDLIRSYEATILREVEKWEREKVLGASEPDLIAYLIDRYTLEPPKVLKDSIHIHSEGDAQINVSGRFEYDFGHRIGPNYVPGTFLTVAIPFEGDADLFGYQPSSFSYGGVRGRVDGAAIFITFQDVKIDPAKVRQEIDKEVTNIEQHLGWSKRDCDAWNARLSKFATQCVQDRKRRLLEQLNMVSAIGLPIKRRPEGGGTFSVPIVRKKSPVTLPKTPSENFKPEPALLAEEYDYILTVIDRLALSIERNPSTFSNMHEGQIRDLILVDLNGHYDGGVTGETFNAHGKTDILIRAYDRNVFIAECKFWEGAKAFKAAIDQLLGYATWRDTKVALLMFSKNADFTKVLSEIEKAAPEHSHFKRKLTSVSDTHARYLFRQKNDADRDICIAVMAFNIPPPKAT